ncbi:MAG: hypothetical protein HY776_01270 [Actinobacteria bacterium]|nr:hypothetical protein [Actinomycetota bacterium]
MGTLNKRTQVLFAKDKYAFLERIARKKKKSVGALIREAVEEKYLKKESKEKEEIIKRLSKMNLPVSDWESMEEEIILGALGKRKK